LQSFLFILVALGDDSVVWGTSTSEASTITAFSYVADISVFMQPQIYVVFFRRPCRVWQWFAEFLGKLGFAFLFRSV